MDREMKDKGSQYSSNSLLSAGNHERRRILVVDDEENMRHMLSLLLSRNGYEVLTAEGGEEALKILRDVPVDLILCDVRMPGMDGLELLEECKRSGIDAVIIMISAYGTLETAIEAMKRGAYDYVQKPFRPDEVILTIRKAEERERLRRENIQLRERLARGHTFQEMVAKSPAMRKIFETIEKISQYPTTVLIQGESGTGKELIARAIHRKSPRARGPFVAVDCGAIPHQLLESELFGHVKGAFTHALQDKKGLFLAANGGTIFLDEIGELSQDLQVKLLRTIQEQVVRPVGGEQYHKLDVRIISATAKDLTVEVREGRFREELFYRLNVINIKVPPLRERMEDVPLLVNHFIGKYRGSLGVSVDGITQRAMRRLMDHHWPGNVRELENVIERAMVLCENRRIDLQDIAVLEEAGQHQDAKGELNLRRAWKEVERQMVLEALRRTNGNRSRAARLLGISHRALLYKLKAMGITRHA
jgi:two-component system response regulator AtoC